MENRPFSSDMRRNARRRRRTRPLMLGATVLASGAGLSATATAATVTPAAQGPAAVTAQEPVVAFDIAPGRLADVVPAFARAAGLKVTLDDPAFGTIQSPGVSGSFSPEEAMKRLLAGTSLRATFGPDGVVLRLRDVSEFVEVSGNAPAPSSPKYTQPLRDTPQTLVVIPRAVLQDQAVTSLRDALRNTPGITLSAGEGGTAPGDNLLIRGFSARNDVYIDGARDPGVASRDTFNIEAVEVAKGPSSVTAGRGSTGGSVNLVTKSANLQNNGEVRFTGGNAGQKRGTLDVDRRLSETVAVRVNGMWQDSGVPGRDDVTQKGWGFAPSIGFGLGRPTTVTVGYQRLQQNNIPDYGLPGTLPDLAVAAGKTVDDLDFSNFYGLLSRDHEKMTSDIVTGTVTHRFRPTLSLRNLTRFGRNYLDRVVTPPRAASAANGASDPGYDPTVPQIRRTDTKYQFRDDRTVTNQTDLTSAFKTGSVQHSVVAGIELAHDLQPSYAATDLFTNGRPPVTDLFHPDPTQAYTPAIARTGASSEAHATSAAAYAFDTVKLSERVQADAGLRWDHVDVDYHTVSAPTASAPSVAADFGRVDKALSGRVGLVYKPVQRGSIYGAYSTSFNPSFDGAFGLTLGATGVNSAALPPERSRNIEVGTKWDLTGTLFATMAAFRMEKTNAKTTDATTGATVLAGNQRVSGVEFGLSGNLTSRWSVFTGLSLMHGTIEDSLVAAEVDKQLSYVPEQSFNVWSSYHFPVNLTVGAGAQYTGGYYFSNTNALATANAEAIRRLTRYWLFNLMASQRLNQHVDLQVNVTNLSATRYVDRGYSGHFIPGAGRSLIVGPAIKF
jgi:catecholate siderophore receptor